MFNCGFGTLPLQILDRIHRYVTEPTSEPLILWGESGCGKTSLLAKGFSLVGILLNVVVIIIIIIIIIVVDVKMMTTTTATTITDNNTCTDLLPLSSPQRPLSTFFPTATYM